MKFDFENGRPHLLMIEGAEGAPAGGGGAPAGGDGGAKPWYDGAAAEDVGYFQNRGWDKVDAKTAAFNAAKAHREAEKLIGAPADKIIRLPNDPNDAEAWRGVRLKLGMPQDAKGYADSLKVVKHANGTDLSADEVTTLSERAFKLGLSKSDALTYVSETIKERDASVTTNAAELEGKLAAQKSALAENWGPNFDANMFVAKRTAGALGVTPEQVAALERVIGYDKVMDMFRNIGTKIGEDKFVNSTDMNNGLPRTMTKEQAVDRKASLMADKAWVTAYLAGDAQKKAEMTALNTMIVGSGR